MDLSTLQRVIFLLFALRIEIGVKSSSTFPSLRSRDASKDDRDNSKLLQQESRNHPQSVQRNLGTLQNLGQNHDGPLQKCQGDCDQDSDCAGNLFCLQRQPNDPVPGCSGGLGGATDYCVESFRLKLYWEEGYDWQDEYVERYWCMMSDYDGSDRIDGDCWHGPDRDRCRSDEVYIDECSDDERQLFRYEYIDDSDEILIVVAGGKKAGKCFQRYNETMLHLRSCDPDNEKQRFYAIGGDFQERRFEISQIISEFRLDHCVTQAHHPKPGEVIEMYPCHMPRSPYHLTSWWETY